MNLDPRVSKIQIVLFIKDIVDRFNKIKIAADISDLYDCFDEEQAVLPIPEDAPPEIPLVLFKGRGCLCTVSKTHINFICDNDSQDDIVKVAEYLFNKVKPLIKYFTNTPMLVFSRIGIVVEGYFGTDSLEFLRQYLFKDRVADCNSFELGFLFNPIINERRINKWVRFSANNDKVGFKLDFNTIDDLSIELEAEDLYYTLDSLLIELNKKTIDLFEMNLFNEQDG